VEEANEKFTAVVSNIGYIKVMFLPLLSNIVCHQRTFIKAAKGESLYWFMATFLYRSE